MCNTLNYVYVLLHKICINKQCLRNQILLSQLYQFIKSLKILFLIIKKSMIITCKKQKTFVNMRHKYHY